MSMPIRVLGRSLMCPTDAFTTYPAPRYFLMVLALAGDSTTTSVPLRLPLGAASAVSSPVASTSSPTSAVLAFGGDLAFATACLATGVARLASVDVGSPLVVAFGAPAFFIGLAVSVDSPDVFLAAGTSNNLVVIAARPPHEAFQLRFG